jgi:hypothetical protein
MRIAVDRGPERVFRYLLREAGIDIEKDRVELSRLRLITPAFPLVSLPGGTCGGESGWALGQCVANTRARRGVLSAVDLDGCH